MVYFMSHLFISMSRWKKDEQQYGEMKEKIQSLINQCYPTYRIAKTLGLADRTVRWWIEKLNLIPAKDGILVKDGKRYKRCPRCDEVKEITEETFYIKRNGSVQSCKVCFVKDSYERHKGFKQKCVDYKGGKCITCGYNKCSAAMDFHHLDPNQKDYQISGIRYKPWDLVQSELDKCILLCRNCHAELHDEEGWKHNQQVNT